MGEQDQAPTELVAGKYRLTKLLGRGGMGSVWEGVHQTLGTRVACKFIEAEYAESPEARSRFENEARAAAALRSKHVVDVYDHGVMDDGRPYIVMEYLSGEPLDARLDRVGRLSLAETSKIVTQVARGLARAHKAGIVHRDLKPENVFLVWDDEDQEDMVKVVDFGIAKFTDGAVGVSSATRTGSVLGTPFYMSPEQARGLRSLDHRSDLWSVGVIAFRCVVGRLPFEGEALGDLLVQICTGPIPVPSQLAPGVPPAFDAWMQRALSREPSERFPDARSMAEELNVAAGGQPRAAMASQVDPDGSGPVQALPGFGTPQPGTTPGMTGGVTNIGLSATNAPKRSSKTPLVVGVAAGVLVLGVGIAFAAKVMSGPAESAAASSAATAEATEVLPPEPPAPEEPKVEPADEAPKPAELKEEEKAAEEEAKPETKAVANPAKKPAAAPRVQAKTAPAPKQTTAKPAPAPKPASKPAPKPRQTTSKKTRPGVDLGY